MKPATSVHLFGLAVAAMMAARVAAAATITYNLAGSAATESVGSAGETVYTVDLVDSNTGAPFLPGFTLDVGDTINGTVTLTTPLTVPAGLNGNGVLMLLLADTDGTPIDYAQSVTFYNDGVQVSPPTQWSNSGGTGSSVYVADLTDQSAPAFTFDQLAFSITATSMLNATGQSVSSVNLIPLTPPVLEGVGFNPVPLPGAAWLLLSGLCGLGLGSCRRLAA